MKFCNCVLLLVLYCCRICAQNTNPQVLYLKSGAAIPSENITGKFLRHYNESSQTVNGKSYCIVQLSKPAAGNDQKDFAAAGIKLLEYIPSNAYLAEISKPLEEQVLKKLNVRAFSTIAPEQKIEPALTKELLNIDSIKIWIMLFNSVNTDTAIVALQDRGYNITSLANKDYKVLEINTSGGAIVNLAALPFVKYIEQAPPLPEPLLNDSRTLSRANLLQTGLAGSYNLDGEGVVIGVAEVASSPFPHVDFADRQIALQSGTNDFHSTHVSGIVAGAGLINELYKGYAPGATILTASASSLTVPNFQRYGMVLTNNSYASSYSCYPSSGSTINQAMYDILATAFPNVQNVFGNGNSGRTTCSVYPDGFKTGVSGAGGAKSTIAVGNISKDGSLDASSSKGPVTDGRIKPEIVAPGTSIVSTIQNNLYGFSSGTSMSSPAVTGGLALMYQRYRQLHSNQNPAAALMKSILCNTASDAGNKGPDFSYGFGQMNLYRAVKAIDSNHYFIDSLGYQDVKTKNISIPAGGAQLKVLLYWQDPSGSVLSSRSLVNDLDITVVSPAGFVNLPYILDTTAANVPNPATKGEDHVNNIEQVVIDFPQAGNYAIKIKGTEIDAAINPKQEYCVTYDLLPNNIMLSYPCGNEDLVPGENIKIEWDSWGADNAAFKLEFSADGGMNWQIISNAIAAGEKQYDWQLPNITTTNAMVRLTRNSDLATSTSGKFMLIGQPGISLSTEQCPGNITLQWVPVAMADYYEVMRIKSGNLIVVDTTSATSFTLRNLSEDTVYWVTTRAVINGMRGRRAVALSRKPDSGNCSSPIFDNDLKADSLETPNTGRAFSSKQLHSNEAILFRIKNLDDQPANNYTISYSVNDGAWVTENENTAIPANSTFIYHFNRGYDFSKPGDYFIKLVVKNNISDTNIGNDTLQYAMRQLPNEPINLTKALIENFEQSKDTGYSSPFTGIKGLERFDYDKITGNGKINFPVNTMSDTSGTSLAFNLIDQQKLSSQSVTATFNLSAYYVATDNILLGFSLSLLPGCIGCQGDSTKLLIRGNDTLPWINVIRLNPKQESFSNKKFEGISLSKYLAAAGQDFSSSFQIKWEHVSAYNSYLLDDVELHAGNNDLAISFADTVLPRSCNIGSMPVRIKISNNSFTGVNNVKVYYKINNGDSISETVPVIPADASLLYTFTKPANLTVPGFYTFEAGSLSSGDAYVKNNSVKQTIRNQPLINKFPYLENFEANNGYWYAEGTNSSWAYGKPASVLINNAASGKGAWKTNLSGRHNSNELSYLYSPCIDYSSLQHPALGFSLALNLDSCGAFICDILRFQYSSDGISWNSLPLDPSAYHWNNSGWSSRNYNRWHVISNNLPVINGPVQFRFSFKSDAANNFEGVAIDDINVYDNLFPICDTILQGVTVAKTINGGNDWVNFTQGNKIIASVNPYGQNPGNTVLKTYIKNKLPVANFHGQYYLNRNFVLHTDQQKLSDSIGIRFYFTDSETDSLLFAKNCPACYKPADAYRFGISQYHSSMATEENDSIADNISGEWTFIENKKIKTVPYQNGYYVEFKVKDVSEFWLNSGGTDNKSWLPVQLTNFTVEKAATITNIAWSSASEINISRFEIQAAKTNEAFINNNFSVIASVNSHGASTQSQLYNYADNDPAKHGVYYYRIKSVDQFGNYAYSKVIPVLYSNDLNWHIYPNPSDGLYKMEYQVTNGERFKLAIYNVTGQLIKTQELVGNGFIQQAEINIKNKTIASGIYIIRVSANKKAYYFKLVKR